MSPASTPSDSPRPTPGQMARRRPTPTGPAAGVPRVGTPATAATPTSDPAKWGRIADDGTVYLQLSGTAAQAAVAAGEAATADKAERVIGQWQAGSPQEGLAHFASRYEDLRTEIALLADRLLRHPDEAWHIRERVDALFQEVPKAAVIGDLSALEKLLQTIDSKLKSMISTPLEAKEKLLKEAEELAENSTDWKGAGDRIRAIVDEWRKITGIDKETDDALWKRYSRARDSFNRRRGAHFADLDRQRTQARKLKEELIEKAEKLKESTNWADTARDFASLMREWKEAGRASRGIDDKLWEQFKAAQDYFFAARNADQNRVDAELAANAAAKDALLAEYTPLINPEKGVEAARRKLVELQEKWEEIGYVPRNQIRSYEDKISALEKAVSKAESEQWRRTDPEAIARAKQFAEKAEKLNSQAAVAAAKGNDSKAAKLREQAEQWQQWADTALNAVAE
ncbi:DUF349 domain-containing protein [Corynebacterium caspium]|uniref:DUF349 domain-containing protein n=1 Tax=Corynebacterium caspium TaxID=234828 RepID=UPI000373743B|nr:DUF349 domain-containing protein [Corynebacterium caspium]WKD59118.1 hypothetical protein CCASP_03570 [Corynebacterium caspium DSM 44850]